MPKVVHIEFKRRRPERFVVYFDDGEGYLFSPETVVKYGVSIDREFSETAFLEMLNEDGIRRAKDQMLRYLSRRPHSRRELLLKTLQKGYEASQIEAGLDDLARLDLVDDARFARQFIQNEQLLRPCGKNLLREKLRQRGISREIFEPILAECLDEHPETAAIAEVVGKFLSRNSRLTPEKRYEKLIRYLQAKGFEWQLIREAVQGENLNRDDDDLSSA